MQRLLHNSEVLVWIQFLTDNKTSAMEKKVRIKQVRSRIGHPKDQKATLDALGLRKINQVKELSLNPQLEGMINKVKHLLQIEEI